MPGRRLRAVRQLQIHDGTNCSFSTRWSVFRFGGGVAENIAVSNCLLYQIFGCPIKMRCGPGSRFENISFSNLVMKDVTGPISIGLGPHATRRPPAAQPGATNSVAAGVATNLTSQSESNTEADANVPAGIVRNISFNNIRATVAKPVPLADVPFISNYNPGEVFSCITLNGFDDGFLEQIHFNGVHVTFPGGGTAEHAAVRDVPKVAGEYYQIGVPPAYRTLRAKCSRPHAAERPLRNGGARFRPALVFDHVADAAVNGFSVQGNSEAESVLRFIGCKDVLLSAARLLQSGKIFLQVEGPGCEAITVDGGDISKAAAPVAFRNGAAEKSVKLRI